MFAGLITRFGLSVFPWKLIGVGLAVLAIVGTIGGGVLYVNNLQNKYVESQQELATQKIATEIAEHRAEQVTIQHEFQVARVGVLESVRKELTENISVLRAEIADLNLEEDIESATPDRAIDRLNAAHRDLNGLLERASKNLSGRAPVAK